VKGGTEEEKRGQRSITPLGKVEFIHALLDAREATELRPLRQLTAGKQLQLEFAVSHQTQICGERAFIDVVLTKILLL